MAEDLNEQDSETGETGAAVSIIDADGTFREGWRNVLDEKIRDEPYLKEVKNIQGMANSVVSARRMVGKNKIAIPTEDSSEEEWLAWHDAGGRPKTAADYNFKRPDNFPQEHWNDNLAKSAMELFHKIGISTKQGKAILEFNNSNVMTALKAQKDAIIANRQEINDGLYKDWGAAYEQKKHLGNYAVEKGTNGDEEFKSRLLSKFGDDPDFIRYSSNLGSRFAEHGDIVASHIPTPADIQTQIDEIEQNPLYLKGTQDQRMKLANQVMKLREKIAKK